MQDKIAQITDESKQREEDLKAEIQRVNEYSESKDEEIQALK